MNVLIVTAGSHGDVHPFLGIGRVLRARGHSVTVAVHPYFAPDVSAAGLEPVSLGEEFDLPTLLEDPDLMHPWRGGPKILRMILEAAPAAMEVIRARIRASRPDLILAHHICFGAPWVAEQEGVPYATAVLAPMFWFSPSDPAPTFQQRPGAWRRRGASLAVRGLGPLALRLGSWKLNRLRRRVGLAPRPDAMREAFAGGPLCLGLWSEAFRPRTPHDPASGVICGFPWFDRSDAADRLDPELESFLDAGPPPVVFSLGTAAVHVPGDFYEVATEACRRLGRRGLLLTGKAANVPPDLPPDILAHDYAPFSLLLPRGAATVHHGGIGSTSQALRAGRPCVVIPHAHDQFNNGVHAVGLGVAAMVRRGRLDATRLTDALRAVLDDEAVAARAAALGRTLAAERSGAEVAADRLEAHAAPETTVTR